MQHDIVWEDPDGELRAARADDRAARRAAAPGSSCSPRCTRPGSRWTPNASPSRPTDRARSSSSSRRASTACGCAARCPRARRRAGRSRSTSSCSPRPTARAPLRQDPPVHATRASTSTTRPATRHVTVDIEGRARSFCSSATTCASPTSSGRSRTTPTATSCPRTGRRRRASTGCTLLRARAIENQAYVVGVNRVGEGGGLAYAGDSMIVDPVRRDRRRGRATARRCSSPTSTRPWWSRPAAGSRSCATGADRP